ncbi:MAG: hypothetical protein OEM38_03530, partial [Gammaproteobacteria bacterium]|nr:hypothetical protein [Gammaproteobacteria bacterium]
AHASSTIIGDKIYVFGGEITTTDTTFTTNEVWEYTISTHHWEAKATMATARQNAASCTVNGYVFLFGGYNVETSEVLSDIAAFHPTSGLSPGITFDNITLPPLKGASCATDGSILYVSGGTTDNVNISNKIYRFEITLDGINDTLTQLADVIDLPLNMSVARYKHQSIISNNQLYIAGGLTTNDVVTPTLEILDLATLQWLPAENITEMDIARYNFSLNIIGDRIYATGGQDSPGNLLNSVEILDPTKDLKTWITGDAMPFKNAAFISEYQPSSETMYLFGGTNSAFVDSNGNSNQMLYSGTNLSWHPLLNTADGIYDTSAGHIGDYVYLIGGREENGTISNKTQTYSISQNSWVTATNGPAPLKTARVNATTVSTNGLIFAIGGIGTVNNEETYLSSMEIYGLDNAPNNWNDGFSEIKYPRANACAIFDKGFIYLIGGENDVGFVKTIERFNPATNEWAEYDTLSKPRAGHSCAIIKGSIYLIGGYLDYATKKAEQIVDTYTPSTTSGKGVFDYTKTSFNQAGIIKPAVSVFNDRIYMFGGITGKLLSYQGTTISEKYTPFTDSWKDLESVPAPTELPLIETPPSNNPYSVVVGNKIYVFANNHILTSLEGDITATRRNSTNIYVLE